MLIKTGEFTALPQDFVDSYATKEVPWGPVGYVTAKRTYMRRIEDEGRTEEWHETCARSVNGLLELSREHANNILDEETAKTLYHYTYYLKSLFSGRHLWQLGTDLVRRLGQDSLQACWGIRMNDPILPFCFLFEELMLGGGVGFDIHPEAVFEMPAVRFAPKITRADNDNDVDRIVRDNREGWVELLREVLEAHFFTGKDYTFATHCIRDRGAKIRSFGGTASGPELLSWGMLEISRILRERHNSTTQKLRPVDVLDICNIIGSVVVAGNARRSAQLALGSYRDRKYLKAKDWSEGSIPNWRGMSNNSVAVSTIAKLGELFWKTYDGNGEPYGLFNPRLAREFGRLADGRGYRSDLDIVVTNPCQPGWATLLQLDGLDGHCHMTTMEDIQIGDTIWSGKQWTKVVNKVCTGVKEVYAYHTRAGTFYGTENHRVLQRGEKVEARDAESIDLPRPAFDEELETASWDPQFVMDGLVLGDGTVHRTSKEMVYLIIGENDGDYHTSEVADRILEHRPGIKHNYWAIATHITEAELPKTYERRIPSRYRFGTFNEVCSFLRGLYSANGSIAGGRVTLKASSFSVIAGAQEMLSSIGIRSYYTTNRANDVEFANGTYRCRQSYDLNITADRQRFQRLVGFLQQDKQRRLASACEAVSRHRKHSYEIVSREWVSTESVYDITVEAEEHTYWTGGLLVSNCSEITLCPYESCNLYDIVLPRLKDAEEFRTAARLGYLTTKIISCVPALYEETNRIREQNHRLGIGVTGFLQAKRFHDADLFGSIYRHIEELDEHYSPLMGVGKSIKLTTVKPSGTMSLLPGVSHGVHPAFAPYYIRRIRMANGDPLVDACRAHGFNVEPMLNQDRTRDHNTMVVEFPVKHDADVYKDDISAIQQLEYAAWLQEHWSDNSVSCSVYYSPDELPDIKSWLAENYETRIKSVSFFLRQRHGFLHAPYEEISQDRYEELSAKCSPLTSIADPGGFELDEGCDNGVCPTR